MSTRQQETAVDEVRLNSLTSQEESRMRENQAASLSSGHEHIGQDFRDDRALSTSAPSAMGSAQCSRCGGLGVVDDGEIDCYSNGEPFANGPIKCVKDCPACSVRGLVDRLRNGGQTDLADMAHGLLANLKFAVTLLEAMPFIRGTAQVDAMRAAIAKALGTQDGLHGSPSSKASEPDEQDPIRGAA